MGHVVIDLLCSEVYDAIDLLCSEIYDVIEGLCPEIPLPGVSQGVLWHCTNSANIRDGKRYHMAKGWWRLSSPQWGEQHRPNVENASSIQHTSQRKEFHHLQD